MATYLFSPQYGLVNQALKAVGLSSWVKGWLGDFVWALPAVGIIGAWVLLGQVAPELGEWATFFAAGAAKRAAAEAGSTRAVTEREADDLVRDADRFLAVVEQALGLVPHVSVA